MNLDRINAAVQQTLSRLWSRFPATPELARLGPLRARVADEIFDRHRAEIEAAHARFLAGDDATAGPDDDNAPFGIPAAAGIVRLAEQMIGELRDEVTRAAGIASARGPLARLDAGLAALDARMPTDEIEYMDLPDLSPSRRAASVRGLDRINLSLGSYVRFLDLLEPLAASALGRGGSVTVLDLASGHGGFPIALARLARARGLRLHIIGSDVRPEYIDVCRERAAAAGIPAEDLEFRVADAFHLGREFPRGTVDIVTCTQALHHFGAGGVAALIAESLRVADRGIVFVDPVRSLLTLVGLMPLTLLTTFDPWLIHDGFVSVRKAFVPEEMRLLARAAPGGDALESFFAAPGFVVLRSRA